MTGFDYGAPTRRPCPGCGRPVAVTRTGSLHRGHRCAPPREPQPLHVWTPEQQQAPNEGRRACAARRDVELAGKLLAAGWLDDRAAAVAIARVRHPDWTWRRIGDSLGLNKDKAAALFRRRCQEAGIR